MLGWFQALMPREERFFELFARHAQVTLAGAEALRARCLRGGQKRTDSISLKASRRNLDGLRLPAPSPSPKATGAAF